MENNIGVLTATQVLVLIFGYLVQRIEQPESAGSVRERWKYRLAVWREKIKAAKKEEAVMESG